jgi:hypothetical protein
MKGTGDELEAVRPRQAAPNLKLGGGGGGD